MSYLPPYFRRRHASGHVILDRAFSVRWEIQPDVKSHHCSDRVLGTNFKLILILCEDSHKIEVFFCWLLRFTSLVSATGSYTEDESFIGESCLFLQNRDPLRWPGQWTRSIKKDRWHTWLLAHISMKTKEMLLKCGCMKNYKVEN